MDAASSSPPRVSQGRALVYAALTGQTMISAGTHLVAKRAMAELDPITLIILRFALSGLLFGLILISLPGPVFPPRGERLRFLRLGLLAGPLNQGLFFYGLQRSTPAHAALLYALTPSAVYVRSLALGQERPNRRALSGIGVAFIGVVVLLAGRGLEAMTGPALGDLFILGAVIAWAFYTAEGKPVIARLGPMHTTAWSMTFAAAMVLPTALVHFNAAQVRAAGSVTFGCMVYLAVLTSVISYLLWYFALSKTEPSKVAVFTNLQPVGTALAAWLILGDPLRWEVFLGGALVLWGVRITQRA